MPYRLHRQYFIKQRRPRASLHPHQQIAHVFSLILNILQGVGPEKRGDGGELDAGHALLRFPHAHPTIPECREEQQLTVPSVQDKEEFRMNIQSKDLKLV